MNTVPAGPAETVDHPTDRTIGWKAGLSNDGRLRGVDHAPQQTHIIPDAPLVVVHHPSTFRGAGVASIAPQAVAQVHTTGAAEVEMAMRGGALPVHRPFLAVPIVVGARVLPIWPVVLGRGGEAGQGVLPPALAEAEAVVLLQARGIVVARCIVFQRALDQTYLRPQSYGFFGSALRVRRECGSGAQ